ncbi:MAG: prolipoprotein diacylglyceryl transferase [Putridiphycobacter sp.]|nr:prolipoprotein diacylglyceryl transferase [Putridiphycobacter sp.]
MTDFLFINWTMDPRVISSWNTPRWYGLMWGLGFYLGFLILNRIYKQEKAPEAWMDKTFIYVLVGGVLGARLGHCLFYQPDIYLKNPIEILYIWEGGLASHGGAIGIIIATVLLNRNVIHKGILWILDRLVVPTALAAFLIRLGNLFNHEILGKKTESVLGFKFLRSGEATNVIFEATNTTGITNANYSDKLNEAYNIIAANPSKYTEVFAAIPARYPAQLIEAICYLAIFGMLMWFYWKTNAGQIKGFLLGLFFITLFGARFFIEFIKENQDGIDQKLEGLNMGQYLSIPLVAIGVYLVLKGIKTIQLQKTKTD